MEIQAERNIFAVLCVFRHVSMRNFIQESSHSQADRTKSEEFEQEAWQPVLTYLNLCFIIVNPFFFLCILLESILESRDPGIQEGFHASQ